MAIFNWIISPRQPLTDPRSGMVTDVWYRFFEALFAIVGNPQFSTQDVFLDEQTNDASADVATAQRRADDALLLGWMGE